MKKTFLTALLATTFFVAIGQTKFKPEDTEFYTPQIKNVTTTEHKAPSDAIVLFDGSNLKQWVSSNDSTSAPTWTIENGILTVKPSSGGIQTKDSFEDFQLHLEWRSPLVIKGEGQARGNSGVFLQGKYEIQILDNNNNTTYVNGQAGSIYKQQPPLVTATKPAGEWHTYDIIYAAPKFNSDGILIKKAHVTVIHNGIVVQNHQQIEGTTEYIGLPKLIPHGAGPITLQDHGDLVSFRNIWIRPLK